MVVEPTKAAARAWLACCILYCATPPGAPLLTVNLDGKRVQAIVDSGSVVTLAHHKVLPPEPHSKGYIPITYRHGDTRSVPARKAILETPHGT